MVLPITEYGNCLLLGCTITEKTKIQRIQNKGLKIIFMRNRLYNTKQLHKDANLASWEVRALIAASRLMFKYKFFPSFIEQPRPGTRLPNGPIFKLARPNSKRFINSVSYRFRHILNEFPSSIRNFDDQELFNLSVKRHFVNHFFSDLNNQVG